MGSVYRSQHELLPPFKKGTAPHVNNVELGKRGRWRSNVWTYTGASSLGSDARRGLKDHPTVKPTAMLEDALLDLSNRRDIVIDPFLGSGSTLIAADKTGRVGRGVELDPLCRRDCAPIRGRDRQPGGSHRDRRSARPTGRA
jgi:DNA modification methylase